MRESKFNPRCHIGEVYGVYTIIDVLEEKDKYGHYIYVGECNECGYKKHSHYGDFVNKVNQFNKCKHLTLGSNKYIQRTKWDNDRIKRIFYSIKERCYNKNNKDYQWYGKRGIKVCDEWLNQPKLFEEWSIKNGYSNNLTIDRINENKDYSPDNCRWISLKENSRRSGDVNWITVGQDTLTGRQWSEKLGLGTMTIDKYIKKYGIDKTKELIEAMISHPPYTKSRKSKQTWFSVYNIKI